MTEEFPSPTGVTYYEFNGDDLTLTIASEEWFPSPTGVTYYELEMIVKKVQESFRPQQGLLIMNTYTLISLEKSA